LYLTDSFFLIGDEMRGCSGSGEAFFSFVRLEEPLPSDHPLRVILGLADELGFRIIVDTRSLSW
jgi:hypothetical protein